jgi:hypothetical protein
MKMLNTGTREGAVVCDIVNRIKHFWLKKWEWKLHVTLGRMIRPVRGEKVIDNLAIIRSPNPAKRGSLPAPMVIPIQIISAN